MAGSEKRQRGAQQKVRFSDAEFADLVAKADRAGLTRAAFMRAAALGSPGPRAQRRLPVDATLLRQVLGQLGSVGNNLNQIARHLNTGREGDMGEALQAALDDYDRMRDALYAALGKDPNPPLPKPPPPPKERKPRPRSDRASPPKSRFLKPARPAKPGPP